MSPRFRAQASIGSKRVSSPRGNTFLNEGHRWQNITYTSHIRKACSEKLDPEVLILFGPQRLGSGVSDGGPPVKGLQRVVETYILGASANGGELPRDQFQMSYILNS